MVIFFGRLITASALLLLCGTATFANAQTHYYVSASSGKDRNNGTSEEKPWKSLARVAQAKLSPGDTVHFKSGDVFNGQLVIDESGSDKAPIHFTAYGNGELPIIDGAKSKGGSEMAAILQHQPTPTNANQRQPTPTNTNQHQPTPTNANQR